MKLSDILKAFLIIADQIGEVASVATYDKWISVKIKKEDGAEYTLDFNVLKEAEKDGN
jgi:hypothetical protein